MAFGTAISALVLDKEQQAVVDSSTVGEAILVAGEMGTGKTLVAVEIIRARNAERVLIAAPKNTRGFFRPESSDPYDGWVGTLRRQGWTGKITLVEKRSQLEPGPGIFILGREFVHASTKDTTKEKGLDWSKVEPFDIAVLDEVHFIKNRKTKAYETFKKVKADFRVGLSGTPYGNYFDGMWSVTKWLWMAFVPASYWRWRYEWCRTETAYLPGGETTEKVVGEKTPGKYVKTLPNYHRLTRKRKAKPSQRKVDLTPAQRKLYTQMERDAVAFVKNTEGTPDAIVASIPVVKRARLREITLGTCTVDAETGEVTFAENTKSAKLDALKEFLADQETAVLVGTHSKKFAKVAAKRLGAELWTGDTSDKDRAAIKARFLSGESKVIVATVRSLSEGADGFQKVCNTVVLLSRDESNIQNDQFIARADRRGQDNDVVTVLDIVAHNTYDSGMLSDETRAGIERMTTLHKED